MGLPRMRLLACVVLIAFAGALIACRYPATEVLVVIDSDAPADRVLTLSATVVGSDAADGGNRMWVRGASASGGITLPASFGVTPRAAGAAEAITLRVEASLAAGARGEPAVRFLREARFRLSPRNPGVLRIFLPMACGNAATGCTSVSAADCTVAVRCTERMQTCGDRGECVSPETTPVPTALDDGSVHSGTDGALDAPASDVANDTQCGANEIVCGGSCVSRLDPAHCGTCTNACAPVANAIASCATGACDFVCNANFHRCGTACVANDDVASCGRACTPCLPAPNSVARCDGVTCGIACNAGFGDCDGNASNGCETNLAVSPANCAVCGTVCPGGASATCASGVCGLSSCASGTGDCDGNAGNACETDTRTSASNCGTCGNVCSFANANGTCTASVCAMGACLAGFANCDGASTNGCEVRTTDDVANCGACGRACTTLHGTPTCGGGVCGIASCDAGYMVSGASCVVAMACGNGVIEGTETCDDSNTAPGDGCFSDCHYEGDPADYCPGTVILTTGLFRGYTTSMSAQYIQGCGVSGGGRDVVYHFIAPRSGTLAVSVHNDASSGSDVILAHTFDCSPISAPCVRQPPGATATETIAVTNGEDVYSYVWSTAAGATFTIEWRYTS